MVIYDKTHPIRWVSCEGVPLFSAEDVVKAMPFDGDYGQHDPHFFATRKPTTAATSDDDASIESIRTSEGLVLTENGVHDLIDYAMLCKGVRGQGLKEFRRWFVEEGAPEARETSRLRTPQSRAPKSRETSRLPALRPLEPGGLRTRWGLRPCKL